MRENLMSRKTRTSEVHNHRTGDIGELKDPDLSEVQRSIDLEWNIYKPWFGSVSFLVLPSASETAQAIMNGSEDRLWRTRTERK
jgi:hypothetical protein